MYLPRSVTRERMCVKEVVSVVTGALHFPHIHGFFIISSWIFYWTVTIRDLFNKSTNQPVHINENVRLYAYRRAGRAILCLQLST